MSLETATYLPDLVASNPAQSDSVANAADHMRLIKGVVKATFPNFTSAPLQSTQAQIDGATLAVDTNGITILADAGVSFKTNTTDKLTNPAAGEWDIVCAGTVAARFMASTSVFPGTVTATTGFIGPGSVPVGGMIMWLSDTLPATGQWAWANGQALSRSTYATLYALIGTTYGVGDGVTTFNLINMQEVVPVGKSTMGAATSPGLLASISAGLKAVLNGLFGTDTYTQARSDLPNVQPTFSGSSTPVSVASPGNVVTAGSFFGGVASASGAGQALQSTNISSVTSSGACTPQGSVQSLNGGVPQTAMPVTQPSRAVNFIVRIA